MGWFVVVPLELVNEYITKIEKSQILPSYTNSN